MDQSSAAEKRAFAVAKLKRAASLPRMKDGRRPPMHVEAFSEGERTNPGEDIGDDENTPTPEERIDDVALSTAPLDPHPQLVPDPDPEPEHEPEPEREPEHEQSQQREQEHEPDPEPEPDNENGNGNDNDNEPETQPEPVSRNKRRPRSRTRSRNSRDLKGKTRPPQSPTPSPMTAANDSSQDESPPRPPPLRIPATPPLVSPIPSHFAELQRSRLLLSPGPTSPELSLFYPGTSPSTPLPSLEALALQRGVFRSNSAAARMMAMHKLTGGTESYDHSFPSPSPTPPLAERLGRNNTVSGGERMAARRFMLMRLGERVIKEVDGEQMSGGEDPPSRSTKRRRRRSRRGSASAPTDAEIPSTTEAPIVPTTPLAGPSEPLPEPPPRVPSATPSQNAPPPPPAEIQVAEVEEDIPVIPTEPTSARRRSILVEEDDIPEVISPQPAFPNLPSVPQRLQQSPMAAHRVPYSSDAPSTMSTDSVSSTAVGVPVYLSGTGTPPRLDRFPSSPFTTPLKERAPGDDDEEQVLFQAESHHQRAQYHDAYDRAISWVADPVPVSRIPIHDDDVEDDEEEEEDHHLPKISFEPGTYDDTSPRASSDFVIECEPSPEVTHSYVPPSPSSVAALSHTPSLIRVSDTEPSPQMYPARLSVASRIQSERSPLGTEFGDWDEPRTTPAAAVVPETSSKRTAESSSTSAWEKVKSTFTRSTSNSGRRSRSNSILTRERRDQTESTVSRESGASLTNARPDRSETPAGVHVHQQHQQAAPLMQSPSPSASASILSLSPLSTGRGCVSPVPAASPSDLAKYSNVKLFPFPGIKKLEEQRNRAKGVALSVSTPDVSLLTPDGCEPSVPPSSSSSSTTPVLLPSDGTSRIVSPPLSAPSTSSHVDSYNTSAPSPPHTTGSINLNNLKLPMNREGVKKWLSARIFSQNSPSPSNNALPSADTRQGSSNAKKRPSLSDLLRNGKDTDLASDWEDIGNDRTRSPTTPTGTIAFPAKSPPPAHAETIDAIRTQTSNKPTTPTLQQTDPTTDTEKTPKAKKSNPLVDASEEPKNSYNHLDSRPALIPPSVPPTPATPDPLSSIEDYAPLTTPESSSVSTSSKSFHPHQSQGSIALERLDEMLGRGPRSPMWQAAIDDPPRKLLLLSPVLQVVNANTVKDRFLFLFSDILVIAKPILQDHDNILDSTKPNPMDRKFIVKSVVLLRKLHFSGDREDPQAKVTANQTVPRNPLIRTFVHQFAKDADRAIATLFEKAGVRDDPVALGQLLFKTLDLDRASLGDYLSRRTSKLVLKAFVDEFGFAGMPVDKALRVFLLSINVTNNNNAMDYLLDAFASRWYEANTGIVAYDKDLAIRLVRALVQLNEMMHGEISQEAGSAGYPRRNMITSRAFVDAIRRFDPRVLISDEVLQSAYESIHRERLCQARNPATASSPDINITIKRPIPPRLTYRVKSEPIVLRIPQADPHFSIHLYGQDLTFEPPVLTFLKSSEASFRVTGTSLGAKTMIMCRSGSNALLYATLPLSNSIVVERAFMRNTFQVAFANPQGVKRRYMFSVDDPLIRHEWTISLKRQVEAATSSTTASHTFTASSKFHPAADSTAYKVLQEVLLGPELISPKPPASAIDKALQRLTSRRNSNGNGHRFPGEQRRTGTKRNSRQNGDMTSIHTRSKSRSQVYHRFGAGRMEPDASGEDPSDSQRCDDDDDDDDDDEVLPQQSMRVEGRLWSGRDLELQCRQNSSIALVLAYLQIGAPDSGQAG